MNALVYFDIIPGHSLGGKFSHFSFSNHILPKTSPIIMDIFFFKSEISWVSDSCFQQFPRGYYYLISIVPKGI